jgi:tyrosine-protein kinase Etk/Wzc
MAMTPQHDFQGVTSVPQASSGEGIAREVSILDILLVVKRRKTLIALIALATTLVGAALAFTRTPMYTATTVILPPQNSSSAAAGMLSSLGALGGLASGGLGMKSEGDMYVALFKSRTVEDGMIRQFNLQEMYHQKLMSRTRAALEGAVKISSDTKTTLITITATDKNPQMAAALANGYVDQYRHLSEHLAISEAAQRRLFFQQQLDESKNRLADAEEALVKTEQSTGLLSLDGQSRALIESAANIRAQITAKQVQIQGIQSYAGPDNAGLQEAHKELAGLKAELAKMGGNSDPDSADFLVPKGKVPEATLEYARKLRDVKYNETIFNILARQFEMAKLDEAKEGALVQVVDPAQVPDYKSSPKRLVWLAASFLLGLFLGTVFVLGQAFMRFLHQDPETDRKLRELSWNPRSAREA